MTAAERKAAVEALEVFARALVALKAAHVAFDVEQLADAHGIPGFSEENDEADEPTDEELAAAHRAREGRAA